MLVINVVILNLFDFVESSISESHQRYETLKQVQRDE